MTDEHDSVEAQHAVPSWLSDAGFAPQPSDQSWEGLALDPAAHTPLAMVIDSLAELLGASDPWGDVTDELPSLTPEQRDAFGS